MEVVAYVDGLQKQIPPTYSNIKQKPIQHKELFSSQLGSLTKHTGGCPTGLPPLLLGTD